MNFYIGNINDIYVNVNDHLFFYFSIKFINFYCINIINILYIIK